MREYKITANDEGQRADRFLRKAAPDLPFSVIQKAFRKKDVKRGGVRCGPEDRLERGDVLRIYVAERESSQSAQKTVLSEESPDIVYEGGHLLVLNKPSGLPCQPDEREPVHNLLVQIRSHLYRKGEWNPDGENSFAPELCHRIDRGTAGLVMAAKTAEALRVMNEKIRLREVEKTYLAVVRGRPSPQRGQWEDFLFKDTDAVRVHSDRSAGAKTAVTKYRVLDTSEGLSLLECTLVTGRTHQIRVQCASRGFPLAGDGKYGRAESGALTSQALLAHRIELCFKTPAGALESLRGKVFSLPVTPDEFFLGVIRRMGR